MSVQKRSDAFGRVQSIQGMLNAELDHRSGSAHTLNVEPDHGPVHEKSGSNHSSEPNFRITIIVNLCYQITENTKIAISPDPVDQIGRLLDH